jgi:predicted Zn finger-like uncharacterized protein
MLAKCPVCSTVFRLGAEQLMAAQGQVKCGVCFTVFSALEQQCEDQETPEILNLDLPAPVEEPVLSRYGAEPAIHALDDLDLPRVVVAETVEAQAAIDAEPSESEPPHRYEDDIRIPSDLRTISQTLLPEVPQEKRGSGLWALASVLLGLLLIWQVSWFRGPDLLLRFPMLRPPLEALCKKFRCRLPVTRMPQAVRVVSRALQEHPNVPNASLFNAIIVSDASFRQPFPVMQLKFLDTQGRILGARRFEPDEYLDRNEIKIEDGMLPGENVHFVLELANPQEPPVGFEIEPM